MTAPDPDDDGRDTHRAIAVLLLLLAIYTGALAMAAMLLRDGR